MSNRVVVIKPLPPTTHEQTEITVMNEKPAAAPLTAADILPKTKKGDKSPLEIIQDARSIIDAQMSAVKTDFSRRLQVLANDKHTLEAMGVAIDWSLPEFSTSLNELGLISDIPTTPGSHAKRGPKPKTNGDTGKDWADTKGGKMVLEAFTKGAEFSIAECSKKTKLAENTLRIYLGKGTKAGYLESLREGRYKRIK